MTSKHKRHCGHGARLHRRAPLPGIPGLLLSPEGIALWSPSEGDDVQYGDVEPVDPHDSDGVPEEPSYLTFAEPPINTQAVSISRPATSALAESALPSTSAQTPTRPATLTVTTSSPSTSHSSSESFMSHASTGSSPSLSVFFSPSIGHSPTTTSLTNSVQSPSAASSSAASPSSAPIALASTSPTGKIIAGAVGGAVVLGLLIALAIWLWKRHKVAKGRLEFVNAHLPWVKAHKEASAAMEEGQPDDDGRTRHGLGLKPTIPGRSDSYLLPDHLRTPFNPLEPSPPSRPEIGTLADTLGMPRTGPYQSRPAPPHLDSDEFDSRSPLPSLGNLAVANAAPGELSSSGDENSIHGPKDVADEVPERLPQLLNARPSAIPRSLAPANARIAAPWALSPIPSLPSPKRASRGTNWQNLDKTPTPSSGQQGWTDAMRATMTSAFLGAPRRRRSTAAGSYEEVALPIRRDSQRRQPTASGAAPLSRRISSWSTVSSVAPSRAATPYLQVETGAADRTFFPGLSQATLDVNASRATLAPIVTSESRVPLIAKKRKSFAVRDYKCGKLREPSVKSRKRTARQDSLPDSLYDFYGHGRSTAVPAMTRESTASYKGDRARSRRRPKASDSRKTTGKRRKDTAHGARRSTRSAQRSPSSTISPNMPVETEENPFDDAFTHV